MTVLAAPMIAIVAALTTTTDAAATTTDPSVTDPAADARAAKVEQALADDARRSRLWYTGWAAFYTVATGFSVKIAIEAEDHDRRVGSSVDAVRSGLGLLTTVLLVPPSMTAPPPGEGDAANREAWLEKAAAAERRGRSWMVHVANAAVNAAGGGYLWLHEHRFVSGLVAFVSGTLIGELKIWTQPMTARDASDALHAASATAHMTVTPLVSTGSFLLALDGRF
ncbi:MAG: hypothetical protein ABI175_11230 [Polyangiales bacterium]